ncbi:MAG: hypothetical protein HYZ21_15580 [Chloroflexi bacterium]|nr:hypothetical protein [Chloroflexota bacterium]
MLKKLGKTLNITPPLVFMTFFYLVTSASLAFYIISGRAISSASDGIYYVCLVWLLGWWLKEDYLKREEKWGSTMAVGVYIWWPLVIPLYLFKTRGVKAFVSILKFLVIYVGSFIVGVIIGILVLLLSQ